MQTCKFHLLIELLLRNAQASYKHMKLEISIGHGFLIGLFAYVQIRMHNKLSSAVHVMQIMFNMLQVDNVWLNQHKHTLV